MLSLLEPPKAQISRDVETVFSSQGRGLDHYCFTWPAESLYQTDVFIGVKLPSLTQDPSDSDRNHNPLSLESNPCSTFYT